MNIKLWRQLILSSIFLLNLTGCKQESQDRSNYNDTEVEEIVPVPTDLFYHYSIWHAFVNKVFEGDLAVEELKTHGNVGLGSYTRLDGELVMLDGVPYRVREDGNVSIPSDNAHIVYANATFFERDSGFNISGSTNYDDLRGRINQELPSKNMFYAFKIHGRFKYMKCGGLSKQEPPFKEGLDVLIPNRPVFERENFSGTMVGFFCPDFIGDINAAGYHLHFISDDRTFGGHVMEFEAEHLEVEVDEMNEYKFVLPDTDAYRNVGFDAAFQYKKK